MAGLINTTVWLCDTNRRVYSGSSLVYREHFIKFTITSETRDSWILDRGDWKINKKTKLLRRPPQGYFGMLPHTYWTPREVDDACYVHENRYRLGRIVQECQDVEVLRAIATLLGQPTHD